MWAHGGMRRGGEEEGKKERRLGNESTGVKEGETKGGGKQIERRERMRLTWRDVKIRSERRRGDGEMAGKKDKKTGKGLHVDTEERLEEDRLKI